MAERWVICFASESVSLADIALYAYTHVCEEGGFRLIGWALDWDAPYTALQINVYLDGQLVLQGKADAQRTDLNQNIAGDIGDYHGYNLWVSTQKTGEHRYSVYAINEGAGSNVCIKEGTVNIPAADTEPPSLSDWKTFNVTSDGFDVSCVSTDNIGVNYVMVNVSTGEDPNKIGHSYIASKNGDVYTNTFCSSNGKEYYVGDDGAIVTSSWVDYDGEYYFVNSSGAKVTNDWRLTAPIDDENGDEQWFYFQSTGKRANNKKILYKGHTYYFDAL